MLSQLSYRPADSRPNVPKPSDSLKQFACRTHANRPSLLLLHRPHDLALNRLPPCLCYNSVRHVAIRRLGTPGAMNPEARTSVTRASKRFSTPTTKLEPRETGMEARALATV